VTDEQLLDECTTWLSQSLFGLEGPALRGTKERPITLAVIEDFAIAEAGRGDTRRIANLLAEGQLSPQGMTALIELLRTNFARPVGRPRGERRDTPVWRAETRLPAIIEFLKERHPELRPAFRKHAIALAAKVYGIAEDTLRNRVNRGRRRNRV
jgi:hypothetical protein